MIYNLKSQMSRKDYRFKKRIYENMKLKRIVSYRSRNISSSIFLSNKYLLDKNILEPML